MAGYVQRKGMHLMKKTSIIMVVFAAFFLVGSVSAYGPVNFDYNGNLIVTYVSQSTSSNDEFGIYFPVTKSLGTVHGNTPAVSGTEYRDAGRCSPGTDIVLYVTTPEKETYSSDKPDVDGKNHVFVEKLDNGSYAVAFEDNVGTSPESEFNDVILNVQCEADPTPVPEFPTLALPIGMIIGVLGGVLFIRETRES